MHLDPMVLWIVPVVVLSLTAHECAHGWTAAWLGDPSARERGRLTLDPIPHLHPVGSLAIPALLSLLGSPLVFAWARPMPVDRGRLRHPRRDSVRVALAGPMANVLLAIAFAAGARLMPEGGSWALARQVAATGVLWNCALAFFNLIPIPPLDGAWVLMHYLKLRHIVALHHFRRVALALMVAMVAVPPSRWLFEASLRGMVGTCFGLVGLASSGAPR